MTMGSVTDGHVTVTPSCSTVIATKWSTVFAALCIISVVVLYGAVPDYIPPVRHVHSHHGTIIAHTTWNNSSSSVNVSLSNMMTTDRIRTSYLTSWNASFLRPRTPLNEPPTSDWIVLGEYVCLFIYLVGSVFFSYNYTVQKSQ